MSETSIERLSAYLAKLSPKAQALLMREFERAIERGDDPAMANLVLEQLRKVIRAPSEDLSPRSDEPARLLFAPLEPFLVENDVAAQPAQIRRTSLLAVWQWLRREGAPDDIRALEAAYAGITGTSSAALVQPVRACQAAVAEAILKVVAAAAAGERRSLSGLGPAQVIEDLVPIATVLKSCDFLDTLGASLPSRFRNFGEPELASAMRSLNLSALQTPQTLPFALSMVMQRLSAPWQIIRLPIKLAGSDDEYRVAGTPSGVVVTMVIHELQRVAGRLRADIKRGQFEFVAEHLKTVHDGIRGLRTELDLRTNSAWGRQLAAIRVDISNALKSEIDSVPGRVRRLLRQRPDKEVGPSTTLDAIDVAETAALIDFVAVCRTYASELAINEITLRTYSDLQQYIEQTTETLVESLRSVDARARPFRQIQVDAAIRFCEVMFGRDYASLMSRAADNAAPGERKSTRAG